MVDIGFTSTGDFDVNKLSSFVGLNNGFVVTWYDQSANAYHQNQYDQNLQPKIVNLGNIIKIRDKPSIDFTNAYLSSSVTASYLTNQYTISIVAKNASIGNDRYLLGSFGTSGTNNNLFFGWKSSSIFTLAHYNNDANYTLSQDTSYRIFMATKDPRPGYLSYLLFSELPDLNTSVTGANSNPNSSLNATGPLVIGAGYDETKLWNGYISEAIIFPTKISNITEIANLQYQQEAYYNININRSFNSSTLSQYLNVTKWYDQSGLSKNAIQTSEVYQPLIYNNSYLGNMDFSNNCYLQVTVSDFLTNLSSYTFNAVAKYNFTSQFFPEGAYILGIKNNNNYQDHALRFGFYFNGDFIIGQYSDDVSFPTSVNYSKLNIYTGLVKPPGSVMYINSTRIGSSSTLPTRNFVNTPGGNLFNIGNGYDVTSTSVSWQGSINEIIVFGTALKDYQRMHLERSQADFYKVALIQ
jgi:hypothetical protein